MTLPVAVVGGGLAGLAAAVALVARGQPVALYEARRQLGGRAASFRDPDGGESVDHCQHVSMGCCSYLSDFCRRVGIEEQFERHRRFPFFTADGRRFEFQAWPRVPAPLHLLRGLLGLGYLSLADQWRIGRSMLRLARWRPTATTGDPTIGDWLRGEGQTAAACDGFWSPILTSALGESIERGGLLMARKVFVDGFMSHPEAYVVAVPRVPLSVLYGATLERWLSDQGVELHLGTAVERVEFERGRVVGLTLEGGAWRKVAGGVIAVPWRALSRVLPAESAVSDEQRPWLEQTLRQAARIESAPITAIHLWFDRPIADVSLAVLVGTLSQWLFHHRQDAATKTQYYQVVISASREIPDRHQIVSRVVDELRRIFPAAREAQVVRSRVVTDPQAVFSATPESESLRPAQATPIANLAVAGDWTATGWPATMEGAVRSGYEAAQWVMSDPRDKPGAMRVADLPRGWITRWLAGPGAA